uniref:Uncharacterized protein n=1 Tax=Panagrolaimus sp. JU765 TaxID=591449 RepID=A0AC34QU32_9BILA
MNFVKISVCPQIRTTSSKIVGFHHSTLYVAPARDEKTIEIYSVNAMIHDSWKRIVKIKTIHDSIEEFTLSPNGLFIYCLFVGTVEHDENFKIYIAKICTTTSALDLYPLNPASGDEFEQVYINNIGLHCGENGLYMYDRTIAMGPIKFWTIALLDETDSNFDEKSFIITPNHIPAHASTHECIRFPIALNLDNREVIKIANTDEILIFNGSTEEWISYFPESANQIDFGKIRTRGIREVYGRSGHRFNAVESKLSVFGRGDNLMAKISEKGMHIFYSFQINKENLTYKLVKRAQVYQMKDSFSYRLASTSGKIALVGRHNVVFIALQPLTLKEHSFLAIQKYFLSKTTGSRITEAELQSILQIKIKLI